jgi:prepilin-type N-terminal cleavage/methylation domain-containing protein
MKKQLHSQAAFTLLEIMLVVLIIGLLIGLAVHQVGDKLNQAREVRVAATSSGSKPT